MPGVVLMQNAGRDAAELLVRAGCRGRVAVCAGEGNNGGDGFVIARHLENRGIPVKVLLMCRPGELSGDASVNYHIVETARTPLAVVESRDVGESLGREFADAEWIIDALLGTGTRGAVREPFVTAIEQINRATARVLAVDLPSGLDCVTGLPLWTCVRADLTATFVARKRGFDRPESREWTGEVHVIDIGVPRILFSS